MEGELHEDLLRLHTRGIRSIDPPGANQDGPRGAVFQCGARKLVNVPEKHND